MTVYILYTSGYPMEQTIPNVYKLTCENDLWIIYQVGGDEFSFGINAISRLTVTKNPPMENHQIA